MPHAAPTPSDDLHANQCGVGWQNPLTTCYQAKGTRPRFVGAGGKEEGDAGLSPASASTMAPPSTVLARSYASARRSVATRWPRGGHAARAGWQIFSWRKAERKI